MRKHRITRLERHLQTVTGCPECGWPHEGEIKVVWYDGWDEEEPPEEEPEYCSTCGLRLNPVITWDDDEEPFDQHRSQRLRQEGTQ
jgi:predicted RNA-binding Zn-ribbon protein involved in translation (DUF1610 family)